MKFIISEKNKKDIFVSLFGIIKSNTTNISIVFKDKLLFIQGMDKSHISLFNIHIQKILQIIVTTIHIIFKCIKCRIIACTLIYSFIIKHIR